MPVDTHITFATLGQEARQEALNADVQNEMVCRLKGSNRALDDLRRALEDDDETGADGDQTLTALRA